MQRLEVQKLVAFDIQDACKSVASVYTTPQSPVHSMVFDIRGLVKHPVIEAVRAESGEKGVLIIWE